MSVSWIPNIQTDYNFSVRQKSSAPQKLQNLSLNPVISGMTIWVQRSWIPVINFQVVSPLQVSPLVYLPCWICHFGFSSEWQTVVNCKRQRVCMWVITPHARLRRLLPGWPSPSRLYCRAERLLEQTPRRAGWHPEQCSIQIQLRHTISRMHFTHYCFALDGFQML